jgi:hypothetical protein
MEHSQERSATADPSAALGMTKGRVAERWKAVTEEKVVSSPWVGRRPVTGNALSTHGFGPASTLHVNATPSFVIPSAAEGSAVQRTYLGNPEFTPATNLSSRLPRRAVGPERTRISCLAALDKAAYAPSLKERRMMFDNATNFYRKSGIAQWRDLRFLSLSTKDRMDNLSHAS